jgi:hypothetical protein
MSLKNLTFSALSSNRLVFGLILTAIISVGCLEDFDWGGNSDSAIPPKDETIQEDDACISECLEDINETYLCKDGKWQLEGKDEWDEDDWEDREEGDREERDDPCAELSEEQCYSAEECEWSEEREQCHTARRDREEGDREEGDREEGDREEGDREEGDREEGDREEGDRDDWEPECEEGDTMERMPEDAEELCAEKCSEGDEGEDEDIEAYMRELEAKCDDGDEEACAELERLYSALEEDEDEDEEDEDGLEETIQRLEEACNNGDEDACAELERLYTALEEGDEDEEREGDGEECEDGDTLTRTDPETGNVYTYICEDGEWVPADGDDEEDGPQ